MSAIPGQHTSEGKAPRRSRRTAAEIRARLIAAASGEFEDNGYDGATTAAIARRAEVTETQLFRYFPSKADLFQEAVFNPLSDHMRRFVDEALASGQSSDDRVLARAYIGELHGFLKQHSRMLMALLVARAYSPASRIDSEPDSLTRYFERGAELMGSRLGKNAQVDPQLMVRVSFAAVLACSLMEGWLVPPELADQAAVDEAINVFVVNGITPYLGKE